MDPIKKKCSTEGCPNDATHTAYFRMSMPGTKNKIIRVMTHLCGGCSEKTKANRLHVVN